MDKMWIKVLLVTVLFLPALVHGDNLIRINEAAHVEQGDEYQELVVINGVAEIDGRIVGNAVLIKGDAYLGNTAYIGGDIICLGGKINSAPGAMVVGSKVQIGGTIGWRALPFFSIGKLLLAGFLFKLISAVIILALSIFMVLMWPEQIAFAAKEAASDLVKSSLIGVIAISILIPLSIGFAITLFGLPISIAIFVFLLVTFWFGITTTSYLIGIKFSKKAKPLVSVLIGFTILKFIHFVPFIGTILYFIALLPGVGAILLTRFGTNHPWVGNGKVTVSKIK